MREVRLYGHLGRKFGKVFRLDVATPAEAIAALRANFEEFDGYMYKHSAPGYHIFVGKKNVGSADLRLRVKDSVIKIIPAVAGAKAGTMQTILGVILIIVGTFVPGAQGLLPVGVSMLAGGIIQMLSAAPPREDTERPDTKPSYTFNGPVNTTTQGNPVSIAYGELICGSQVVSLGLSIDDIYVPPVAISGTNGIDYEIGFLALEVASITEVTMYSGTYYAVVTRAPAALGIEFAYNVAWTSRSTSDPMYAEDIRNLYPPAGVTLDAALYLPKSVYALEDMPEIGTLVTMTTPDWGGAPNNTRYTGFH